MPGILRLFAAIILVVAACLPAAAWEYSMRGEWELRYRYISRTGPNDLFGNADVAQQTDLPVILGIPVATSIGLSGPNNRYVQVEGYSSKGSDASYGEERLWLYPRVKVNEAISLYSILSFSGNLNGPYNPPNLPNQPVPASPFAPVAVSQFNYYVAPSENWATNTHYSGWFMLDSRDIVRGVALTVPVVHALWAKLVLPWGTIVAGPRPAGFGMGWVVHEEDNYSTSISLIVPYGPLTLVVSQYLHDTGEYTDPNNVANRFPDFRTMISNYDTWPFTPSGAVDRNKAKDWNQACAVVYRSGSLDMGAMARVIRWSNVHAASRVNNTIPGITVPPLIGTRWDDAIMLPFGTQTTKAAVEPISGFLGDYAAFQVTPNFVPMYGDVFFLLGSAYLKHSTGRISINAEYDFQLIEVRRKGGRPVSGFPQAWAAEMTYLAGPLKLSGAHFFRSGHDRRWDYFNPNAPLGGGPPFAHDQWNFFLTAWGGGQAPIEPYNFLIGLYGTGNNSYNAAGNCTYKDFLAWAARIDYAAAANLNIFASFVHAERASNTGTSTGLYDGMGLWNRGIGEYPNAGAAAPIAFATPNVPDNDLGWEADAGFQWKLLENCTLKFLFAYWQPGLWFNWAYVDWSRRNPSGGLFLPLINPYRPIDPLIAMQSSVLVEF